MGEPLHRTGRRVDRQFGTPHREASFAYEKKKLISSTRYVSSPSGENPFRL